MKRPGSFPTRDYLCSHVISHIPLLASRMAAYRRMGLSIGSDTTILMSVEMQGAEQIVIGNNTVINQHCYLDGRNGLVIGNNVNVSPMSCLLPGNTMCRTVRGFEDGTSR